MKFRFFNKRGAAMIEYSIILAFVACIGTSFVSDNGLGSSVSNTINKVVQILDGTKDSNTNILHNKTSLITDKCLEGQNANNAYLSNRKDVFSIVGNDGKLIELEEGEYELVFDREMIR